MSDIKSIIQLMIDNNEPQEKIEEVINLYNSNADVVKPVDGFSFDYKVIDDPKSGEDVVRSLASIEKSTNISEDLELRKLVLDKVFNEQASNVLTDIKLQDAIKYGQPSRVDNLYVYNKDMAEVVEAQNKKIESENNKNILNSFGEEKFNLYKEFNQNGDLDLRKIQELEKEFEKSNKDAKFNPYSNILANIQYVEGQNKKSFAKRKKEEYLKNNKNLVDQSFFSAIEIDEDVEELYNPDFIENYKSIEKQAKQYTLDATPTVDVVSYTGPQKVFNLSEKGKLETRKDIAKKAIEAQNKYLTEVNNVLNKDIENYNNYLKTIKVNNSEELEAYLNNEEIDIEQRRNVLNKSREINNDIEEYQAKAVRFNDMNAALEALDKSYSNGYRFALALENAIFADMGLLVKGIGAMTVDKIAPESKAASFMKDAYRSHINYAESVKQKQETQLPATVKVKDVGFNNLGRFITEQVAENGFSIATALTYGGVTKRLASEPLKKYAKRALQTTFFTVEGGGSLSQMEIMQKNAAENIKALQAILDEDDAIPDTITGAMVEGGVLKFKMSEDERLEIQKEIERNERALNYTQAQRAFNALGYGTVATVAETFGTMKFIDDFAKLDKLNLGNLSMRSIIKGTGQFIKKGPVTELVEETLTQGGHNFLDNLILKDNKSLADGIDPDFVGSVLVSSVAIGGPTISSSVRNAFRNTFQTRTQTKEFQDLAVEYIENQYILNEGTNLSKGGINKKQADFIKARQLEILEQVGIKDIQNYLEVTNLDGNKIKELFEISRKQGALYNQAASLGVTGLDDASIKKDRDRINKEYNDLQSQKEAILGEPANQRNKKLKQTAKENGLEESDAIKASFDAGRAAYWDALVNSLGGKVIKFDGENIDQELNDYLDDAIKSGKLKDKKLKDGTVVTAEQQKQAIIEGAKTTREGGVLKIGGNGTFVGNDIITFENNRRLNMLFGNDIQRADAQQVAVHELQHMFDINTGLVKDGKVVSSHKPLATALKQYVENLYKDGDITKKTYDQFKQRVAQYSNKVNKNKVVDQAELLTLIGTMKRAGMLKKEQSSLLYSLKSFINKVRKKVYGDDHTLLNIKTTKDMLRYIDTFNNRVEKSDKALSQLPPEEDQTIKQSLGADVFTQINNLIPDDVKTKADFDKFFGDPRRSRELGKALSPGGLIDNVVKQRTVGDEYEKTIDGVRDRVLNYDPAAQRKTDDDTPVTFAERIFSDTRFARMDARKALATKKPTVRLDDPEIKDIPDETPTPTKKVEDKTKKTVVAKKLNVKSEVDKAIKKQLPKLDVKNLTFKKLKNLVPETTGRLFGISPKKLKTLANITKPELQKAQMYISKNADLLLAMLPKGATISGTSTGVPKTLLKAFYTKTAAAKFAKTGSRAGLPIQVKNKNITKKQFLEVFGIINGKPTRDDRNTSARVLALANLTGKMMTNQAVRENLELLGDSEQTIKSIKEGTSSVMFSLGISNKFSDKFNLDFKSLDILDPKNSIENYHNFLENMFLLAEYMPDGFIRRVDLFNFIGKSKTDKTKEFIYRYAETLTLEHKDTFAHYGKVNGKSINRSFHRPDTFFGKEILQPNGKKKNVVNLKKITKKQQEEYNKSGTDNFNTMINGITKALKDNPNNKQLPVAIHMYLSSSVNDTTHPLRGGAKYLGGDITATGEIIFEHAVQSARARDIIMDALLDKNQNFDEIIKALKNNYYLIGMSKKDANKLKTSYYIDENGNLISYENGMGVGWDLFNDKFFDRYFNLDVNSIDPNNFKLIKNNKTFAEEYGITTSGRSPVIKSNLKGAKVLNNAISSSRSAFEKFQAQKQRGKKFVKDLKTREKFEKFQAQQRKAEKFVESIRPQIKQSKGITILDFDDTLATTKSLVKYTAPDGTTGTLNAEQFASTYQDLQERGYKFDFSDFNKVVKGKLAPLFQKALKLQNKFGPENMFVLTARPPQSQKAIFDFLKANGLNIPLKNITGLGNSTSEAKALWVADKVAEGYNDFYFADDALQNVQAVKNMLDQFDVKSKVQQAKVNFSKGMSVNFNKILEDVTGIEFKKRFSDIKARKRGASKGKFRFFIPPSHEDFVGLLYNFMGKGRKGDQHRDFFEKALVRPLNRAYREIDAAKQAIANDYKSLNKQFPDIKKKLTKNTPDGDFTFQDAIRVYIWNKHGYDIPGLSQTDQKNLVELVNNDANLKSYAETVNLISKQETYVDPGPNWETGNIRIDLIDATGRVGRASYFAEFNENAEIIFSPENLNKIEAAYGKGVREALEDMLHRIKTGVNRPKGASAKPNMLLNWLNASVSGVMFFNTRSALLQQLSNVNFLNFADNNIFAAAKAFANQKQYWKDFAMIFNSDMLKQRRGGIGTDINGAELAEAVKKARPGNLFDQVAIITGKALKLGFLPTQIGDSIAIATGGATFYRNRVNKYIKDGLSKKEAETKAFTDLQDITQSTQQSARPDMTSQQQAAVIGKIVLNFLNTPSQYNRIIKKAGSDIINRRITPPNTTQLQSDMSNMSRILYYGAAQNLIFYSLQTALFAVMFGLDDEDEQEKAEQFLKKKERVINGSIDTILRGSGIYGVAVSTVKNMLIKFLEQREKGYNKDESAVIMEMLNFSPVVGIKARKIVNAEKTLNYNKKIIDEMSTFDIDNPIWSAVTNYVEVAGPPANRVYQKTINLRNAMDNQYTAFQRAMFFSGYTTWSLGLGDTQKMKDIKEKIKLNKKNTKKSKKRTFRVLK